MSYLSDEVESFVEVDGTVSFPNPFGGCGVGNMVVHFPFHDGSTQDASKRTRLLPSPITIKKTPPVF